jgi:hypothetical protein
VDVCEFHAADSRALRQRTVMLHSVLATGVSTPGEGTRSCLAVSTQTA